MPGTAVLVLKRGKLFFDFGKAFIIHGFADVQLQLGLHARPVAIVIARVTRSIHRLHL